MAPTPAQRQAAAQLKEEGNALFAKGKYAAAAERYTDAICIDPNAVLFVNRAMAYKKQGGQWQQVMDSAQIALSMEKDNMKAHYLLGVALREQGNLPPAISHLTKALEAAREKGDAIKDEIWRELARAKYAAWQTDSAARSEAHAAIKRRLLQLLEADEARELAALDAAEASAASVHDLPQLLRSFHTPAPAGSTRGQADAGDAAASTPDCPTSRESGQPAPHPQPPSSHTAVGNKDAGPEVLPSSVRAPTTTSRTSGTGQGNGGGGDARAAVAARFAAQRAQLESVFALAAHLDRRGDVPSAFTCPLTMEVYREPAVTPGGQSYERAKLMEALAKVGPFDPISREPMSAADVRPNLALRAATQQYLEEHPWAWKECI